MTIIKTHLLSVAAVAALALGAAHAASAQSIDYDSAEQLFNEPVTTSATGTPQRSTETPADMQIITADEIRRSGETTLPGELARQSRPVASAPSPPANLCGDGRCRPRPMRLGPELAKDGAADQMWLGIEGVVDGGVGGEAPLG
jgi:hypothetical protein